MHFPALTERWQHTRAESLRIAAPLSAEDACAQSMPDASPIKWHLAHTTWFFETFILEELEASFRAFHPAFRILFNSYYNGIGEKHPRPQRGLLTRPDLSEVLAYRQDVDQRILQLLLTSPSEKLAELIELGIQHEQQHQELMLTDIKHLFSCNPLYPAMYTNSEQHRCPDNLPPSATPFVWMPLEASLLEIGYRGRGFCFDNETPRHRQFVEAFELASQLVTNAEYLAFIEDGGYQNPALWLAEGWDWIRQVNLQQPLYWHKLTRWQEFTLGGLHDLNAEQAVCHISYFEAAAYATWAQARLPTEAEWEYAAQQDLSLQQLFDCCWQWTSSSYAPYPGYAAQAGAIGEYNGKFMVNQYVLRGSSAYTPLAHARVSYRNFFPATARWQRTGIRLARSIADTD